MVDKQNEIKLFVPGRLCLFGEHSDWAAERGLHTGYCLVVGTDQGISATVTAAERFTVGTLVPDKLGRPSGRTRQMSCNWNTGALLAAAKDESEFFRYCAGTAYQILSRHPEVGAINMQITAMDLPLRKGVSSSAAVCVAVAKAFNKVYDLGLFPHELMEIAYLGENLTGSQCGRMDQVCIYGRIPVLLTCQKQVGSRIEPIFPESKISMLFVDLAGKKDTVKILSDLQTAYSDSPDLQRALGTLNEQIIRKAFGALKTGNAELLGSLMNEAQQNFDTLVALYSSELTSPLLHELLSLKEIGEHVYGGKGVGSQGDGTAQFVARSNEDRDIAIEKIMAVFPKMQCFPLNIVPIVV